MSVSRRRFLQSSTALAAGLPTVQPLKAATLAADRAEARFANGVLTVEIPRIVDEATRPRTITVKAG